MHIHMDILLCTLCLVSEEYYCYLLLFIFFFVYLYGLTTNHFMNTFSKHYISIILKYVPSSR